MFDMRGFAPLIVIAVVAVSALACNAWNEAASVKLFDPNTLEPVHQGVVIPGICPGDVERRSSSSRRLPFAPVIAEARDYGRDRLDFTVFTGMHFGQESLRISRRELGVSDWSIVYEGPPYDHNRYWWGLSWEDWNVEPGVLYEYALCQVNPRGIGPALVITAGINPPVTKVGPPRNLRILRSPHHHTVFWDAVNDDAVTGYEVEGRRAGTTGPFYSPVVGSAYFGTENYANAAPFRIEDDCCLDRSYTVRALTPTGVGPWSDPVVYDNEYTGSRTVAGKSYEVVSSSVDYDRVHMVWDAYLEDESVAYRLLRRAANSGSDFQVRSDQTTRWIDESEFDWAEHIELPYGAGFTDYRWVCPDTEYEYALQIWDSNGLGPTSPPFKVHTPSVPTGNQRRPAGVCEVNALPRPNGVLLKWDLPEDPSIKGIQIMNYGRTAHGHWVLNRQIPLLDPSTTHYLVKNHFPAHLINCFYVRTFNDYGVDRAFYGFDEYSTPDVCFAPGEINNRVSGDASFNEDPGLSIAQTSVHGHAQSRNRPSRRERTISGIRTTRIGPTCDWDAHKGEGAGTPRQCQRVDTDIRTGKRLVYELVLASRGGFDYNAAEEYLPPPDAPIP